MKAAIVVALAAVAGVAAVAALGAQATGNSRQATSQNCRVDSTAAWYKKQRAWLDESAHAWTNDTLRTMLLSATGVDPAKLAVQTGVRISGRGGAGAPSAEIAAAIAQIKRGGRGGPGPAKSVVGPAGVRAFYMMALADSTYTIAAMHRLMEAGPEESLAADVAVLEDITRLGAGRKQIYGTQFRVNERGDVVLAPMEDSAHADLRRENAGFPPFAVSLCLARAGR